MRSDIGLAGIGLEANLGYVPRGTEPRDLLDFTQQLDLWSCLGLPLLVFLTVPNNTAPDPLGNHTLQVKQGAAGGIIDAQTQCEVVRNLVRLFISKQAVQGSSGTNWMIPSRMTFRGVVLLMGMGRLSL